MTNIKLTQLESITFINMFLKDSTHFAEYENNGSVGETVVLSYDCKPLKGYKSKGINEHSIVKPDWFSGTPSQWSGVFSSLCKKGLFENETVGDEGDYYAFTQMQLSETAVDYLLNAGFNLEWWKN